MQPPAISKQRFMAALLLLALFGGTASATTFPNQGELWSMDQVGDFGAQVAAAPNIVAVFDPAAASLDPPTVFVFQKLNGTWTETARLIESDASDYTSGSYKASMAMSDTGSTIAIGIDSGTDASGSPVAGAIYVFQEPTSGWHDMTETARLSLTSSTGCQLGDNIAADDSYVVASYLSDCPVPSGMSAIYGVATFQRPSSGWGNTSTPQATIPDYVGNYDSDTAGLALTNDWVAACTGTDTASQDAVTLAPAQTGGNPANPIVIAPPAGLEPASWCNILAASGNSLALAPTWFGVGSPPNGVLEYDAPTSGWQTTNIPTAILTLSNGGSPGSLLAMSPNLIAASGPYNGIYVFEKPSGGWVNANETLDLTPPTPSQDLNVMNALAATDSFIAVSEDQQTCPPPIANGSGCQLVYVYDSSPVAAPADAVVHLALSGKAAITGQLFMLTATVTNQSSAAAADNAQVTLPLPPQLSLVQIQSSQGSCQLQSGVATCALGTLAETAVANVTLTAAAPLIGQTLTQTAMVTTSSPVRSLRDNQTALSYLVDAPPVASDIQFDVTAGEGGTVPLVATDTDGNPLTYRIVTEPKHGTIEVGGVPYTGGYAGGFVYVADNKSYIGPDSFTYVANDGYTDSNVATASVTIQAPPPTNPSPKINPLVTAATGSLNPIVLLVLCAVLVLGMSRRQHRAGCLKRLKDAGYQRKE